jgi:hypothetical protein
VNDEVAELLSGREKSVQIADHIALLQRVGDQLVIGAGLLFEKLVLHVRQHQRGSRLVDLHLRITVGEGEHAETPSPELWSGFY